MPESIRPAANHDIPSPEANTAAPAIMHRREINPMPFWPYRSASMPAGMEIKTPTRQKKLMRDPAWAWVNPNSLTNRGKMGGTD